LVKYGATMVGYAGTVSYQHHIQTKMSIESKNNNRGKD
jgi:hypothetical protein